MIYDKRSDIIELVELDQRIATHSQEVNELTEKKAQLEQEKEQVTAAVAAAKKVAHDLKIKIDGLDLELTSLDKKLERTKEKMLTVSSKKELDSLEHEQESITQQKELLDEQGLVLLMDLEKAQKEAATVMVEQPKKEQVIEQELDELDERLHHVEKLIAGYQEQRPKIVAKVPDDFLRTYDNLMARVANPVVPIIKESCSGCFHRLTSAEKAKARQGEFVSCQGCYRLNYLFKLEEDNEE